MKVKPSFFVIVSLTIDLNRQGSAISLALENQFVAIAVESPTLNEELRF
jgi:hypothetical protein